MQTCWLHRNKAPACLLFMAGWGMGPEPFADIGSGGMDVLMVYDYRSLDDCELSALLPADCDLHLLAWSMGVRTAAALLHGIAWTTATALGGTLMPLDDQQGIPTRLFDNTIAAFSPDIVRDFYSSMFDAPDQAERFRRRPPDRPVNELLEELAALRKFCTGTPPGDIYTRRLVTGRDRIFPARNQLRAWGRDNCTVLPLPHFPFYRYASWAHMLTQDTP